MLSWWLTWVGSLIALRVARIGDASTSFLLALGVLLTVAAAALAVVMIRSISLRIREIAWRWRSVPLPKTPFYGF